MVLYIIHAVITLLWDGIRLWGMAVDDKTIEVLVLRQQLLILRRHQKRGPSISQGEKFILKTLLEPCRAEKPHLARYCAIQLGYVLYELSL